MKKNWMIIAMTGLLLTACGSAETDDKKDDKKDAKTEQADGENPGNEGTTDAPASTLTLDETLDLTEHDVPLKIQVPAGTELEVKSYGIYVEYGDGFKFEPTMDFYEDVDERKKEVEANDLNKLKRYVKETENGFIAENEVVGKTVYHVFYLVKGNGFTISLENDKAKPLTLADAEFMWKAFETAEALEATK